MNVIIRILKTEYALKKMTDVFIARDIALEMQGKILLAVLHRDGDASIVDGQGFPAFILPKGSFRRVKAKAKPRK